MTLEDGAAAFKAFLNPQPERPRDESGRFAPTQTEGETVDDEEATEAQAPDDGDEDQGDVDETDEAPDEGQQDDVPMPASWSKDDEGLWTQLPVEARAKLAERETQRETAVNAKFQESANIAKAAQQQVTEANANRDNYAKLTEQVAALVQYPEPDPTQYGLGGEYFDRDNYDLAHHQWRQANAALQYHAQQQQQIAAQQAREAGEARTRELQAVEEVAYPKFVADVPDLNGPKAQEIIDGLIKYGVESGIDRDTFRPGEVSSREMHILWKAQEYDRIKAAKTRVTAANPPPKPAGPVVKPGGVTPRATIQANRLGKAQTQLAKSGSVKDAAAVYKALGF